MRGQIVKVAAAESAVAVVVGTVLAAVATVLVAVPQHASGDCAAVPGSRFACALAGPQAAHAADALARLIEGRRPKPYSPCYVARAVTLGRKNAVGQFTRPDDSRRRAYLTGRTAVVIKELASRGGKFGARTGTGA
ncbi:hypothetical protein PL81_11510 [Streptomyces sp. RSD-27]|nr:hypothetical protein PL81_11510 [Streptomyces sp. RSD-27]